jgi:hypothetical protein
MTTYLIFLKKSTTYLFKKKKKLMAIGHQGVARPPPWAQGGGQNHPQTTIGGGFGHPLGSLGHPIFFSFFF